MNTVVASCFCLEDPRLTMPEIKEAALPGAGFMGRAFGAAKNLPTVMGNSATQTRANFNQGVADQHVNKLSPEQAAANAAPKAPAAPKTMVDHLSGLSGRQAAGLGASALALKGWVDPGTETDEYGHTHQKSRLNSALSGAVTGAGAGLLAAPLIRGGTKLHAQQTAPAAAPRPAPAPAPTAPPNVDHLKFQSAQGETKVADFQTPATNPVYRAGNKQSPAGGAPQGGVGVKAAEDKSKEKAKDETDPELNSHADEKLPYKVPSLKIKK